MGLCSLKFGLSFKGEFASRAQNNLGQKRHWTQKELCLKQIVGHKISGDKISF